MAYYDAQATALGWDELRCSPEMLQAGDIIQTRGPRWLARLIRRFTRRWGEGPTWSNHTAMVLTADPEVIIVEALWRVTVRPIEAYRLSGQRLIVHRLPEGLARDQARAIAREALTYQGRLYGAGKLVLHGLDHLLGGVYLFRRLCRNDYLPICSWLVAQVYKTTLGMELGVAPNAAAPDDIMDYCVAHGWKVAWADSPEALAGYREVYAARVATWQGRGPQPPLSDRREPRAKSGGLP